jgi:virginiamycin B lyase
VRSTGGCVAHPMPERHRMPVAVCAMIVVIAFLVGAAPVTAANRATAFANSQEPLPGLTPLGHGIHAFDFTPGADGDTWFGGASYYVGTVGIIGHIDADGAVTTYEVPNPKGRLESSVSAIVAAPGGYLWFTDSLARTVGRVSPDGQIVVYELPPSKRYVPWSAPRNHIALGPDGNLWVTDGLADKVDRVTPAGEITVFPLAPRRTPVGIVAGPDGALWFAERGGHIGRITTAGEVTEYAIPGAGADPIGLTIGPDGALWFTERTQNKIGRITTGGDISLFSVPIDSGARSIVAGPDQRLWFTTRDEVGSISTTGDFSEPGCIEKTCLWPPSAIGLGGDGAVWVGTGLRKIIGYNGAGTIYTIRALSPGFAGRLTPPVVPLAIGPFFSPMRGRRLTIRAHCGPSARCKGTLRLISAGQVATPSGLRRATLAKGTFSLAPGEERQVPLRLRPVGLRLLGRIGSLTGLVAAAPGFGPEGEAIVKIHRDGHSDSSPSIYRRVAGHHRLRQAAAPGASVAMPMLLRLHDLPPGYEVQYSSCNVLSGNYVPRTVTEFAETYRPAGCKFSYQRLWQARGEASIPWRIESAAIVTPSEAAAEDGLRIAPQLLHVFAATERTMKEVPPPEALGDASRLFEGERLLGTREPVEGGKVLFWRSGAILAAIWVSVDRETDTDRFALDFARIQQARIESPSPYTTAERDDTLVPLENPFIRIPIHWLGRTFRPGRGLPVASLQEASTDTFRNEAWLFYDRFSLDISTRERWTHLEEQRGDEAFSARRCSETKKITVRGGYAEINSGYVEDFARCPARAPTVFLAAVHLGRVVVDVEPSVCPICFEHGSGAYNSRPAMEAVARGLRLRR